MGDVDNEDSHDFFCDECGFLSQGHPTKVSRDERKRQHKTEHETGEPMPELADFRKD